MQLAWHPRGAPLVAKAVAGTGEVARALGRRLAALDDAALARLAAVAGDGVLVVLGEDLPWVDGVTYLGTDRTAPELLISTTLAPSVPPALLLMAARRRADSALVAVLPDRIVPCGTARAVSRARLEEWLA